MDTRSIKNALSTAARKNTVKKRTAEEAEKAADRKFDAALRRLHKEFEQIEFIPFLRDISKATLEQMGGRRNERPLVDELWSNGKIREPRSRIGLTIKHFQRRNQDGSLVAKTQSNPSYSVMFGIAGFNDYYRGDRYHTQQVDAIRRIFALTIEEKGVGQFKYTLHHFKTDREVRMADASRGSEPFHDHTGSNEWAVYSDDNAEVVPRENLAAKVESYIADSLNAHHVKALVNFYEENKPEQKPAARPAARKGEIREAHIA